MSGREARRRVALLVHTASDWTRMLLKGVSSYLREVDQPWNVFLEPRGFQEKLSLPRQGEFDGVILRLTHPELQQAIERGGLPAVNVSWLGKHSISIPKVVSDERGCAAIGVRHLIDRGYARIAFLGPPPSLDYSDTTLRECQRIVGQHADYFSVGVAQQKKQFAKWLGAVSKPAGILAWNTSTCKQVLDMCMEHEVHVPHDLGIVCIEHDHLIAAMCETPLTSIDQDPLSVGYAAARLLDELMHGGKSPDEPLLIRPHGIILRQSTEIATTEDSIVAAALEFIQEAYARPIRVGDICEKLDISRRQLEHRFRDSINSTPANEIRRVRLANVKRLLVETSLSLDKIANMSGYDYTEVMTRAFKQVYGKTPSEFRKTRSGASEA